MYSAAMLVVVRYLHHLLAC